MVFTIEELYQIYDALDSLGINYIEISKDEAIRLVRGDYGFVDPEIEALINDADRVYLYLYGFTIDLSKNGVETGVIENVFPSDVGEALDLVIKFFGVRKFWDILARQHYPSLSGSELRALAKKEAGLKLNSNDEALIRSAMEKLGENNVEQSMAGRTDNYLLWDALDDDWPM